VFYVDKDFIVKRVLSTDENGKKEFEWLLLTQSERIIQVYATTMTDKNNQLIVMERAKNGNLEEYYGAFLDKFNKDRKGESKWCPLTN